MSAIDAIGWAGLLLVMLWLFYWPLVEVKLAQRRRERLLTQDAVDKVLNELAMQVKEAVAMERSGKKVAIPSNELRIAFYIARENALTAGRAVHQQPEDYYQPKPLSHASEANTLAQYEMVMATAFADFG